jgi:chemotaxis protein CheX
MKTEISPEELTAVIDEIFETMAGLHLTPSTELPGLSKTLGSVVAAVQIVGEWQGAVRLDIDLELARQACANLMGLGVNDLSAEDIRDASGELANMTGGSVKALRSPNSKLSLPSVVVGNDFEFSLFQGTVIQTSTFSHESGSLSVSIIERHPGTMRLA